MRSLSFLVLLDIFIWVPFGILIGYISTQLPLSFLKRDMYPTNPKTDTRLQKYLKIKSWKDKLPEAGATFDGGVSKKQLSMQSVEGVERFIYETRRAEFVHIYAPVICFLYFFFNPLWLALLMFAICILLNLPFTLIQRYNRARCLRILSKLGKDGPR